MGIDWDPRKALDNLRKHNVDFADAVIALEDENALTIEDRDHDEQRFKTLGLGANLTILYVIYVYRDESCIRLVSSQCEKQIVVSINYITKDYTMSDDFSRASRGAILKSDPNKVRITIRLDADIIDFFKNQVHSAGGGNYQTLINNVLRRNIETDDLSLEDTIRKVIREELKQVG